MRKLGVVDYGMGNLHSVTKALGLVAPDHKIIVTSDKTVLNSVDRLVVPGVGAIRDCVEAIRHYQVDEVIKSAMSRIPCLGVCVGMQVLVSTSQENNHTPCLDIIPGAANKLSDSEVLKVPHMGWNQISIQQTHPLLSGIKEGDRFYFVHSYAVSVQDRSTVLATCEYGQVFDAVIAKDNLVAVQFHPEKSQKVGLQLLRNFVEWQV